MRYSPWSCKESDMTERLYFLSLSAPNTLLGNIILAIIPLSSAYSFILFQLEYSMSTQIALRFLS